VIDVRITSGSRPVEIKGATPNGPGTTIAVTKTEAKALLAQLQLLEAAGVLRAD
jgi:hypothetical protein